MSIDYTALASEINNDPALIGYSSARTSGNDGTLATLINAIGVGATFQVNREPISAAVLFSNIASADFLALTDLKLQQLNCVLSVVNIDLNDASTQAILIGIFGNPSTTRTNMIALLKRQASRAEILFGRGTVLTVSDIAHALRNGG